MVVEMTGEMAAKAVAFLRETLPSARAAGWEVDGWADMAQTAFQIGCTTMIALGAADATPWGARAKADPQPPQVLPFWEDIAVAVLWLARQQNLLSYRQMDGPLSTPRAGGFVVTRIGAPPPPAPNIAAGPGTGPARASAAVMPVLEALGLVHDARWTALAEVVHWRGTAGEWGLEFEADARFLAAVEEALATLPSVRRQEIDRLMRVSSAEIAETLAHSVAAAEEARAKWGERAHVGAPMTSEQVRLMIPRLRENTLDWIFFRHWRFGRGWLDAADAERALGIFHDRLGSAMRRAAVARLYPAGFVWE